MRIASYSAFAKDLRAQGLEYALRRAAALGFEAVEVISDRRDALPTPAQVRAARARFDAYGLPVVCYSAVADLSAGDPAAVEKLKRHAEYAAILGSPYLHHTLLPALSRRADAPAYGEVLPRVLEGAAQVASHAAALGVICLYEPQGMYFNGTAGLGTFFAALRKQCPDVGICADAGNPLFVHADSVALTRHFAPHVRHVHVKNYAFSTVEPTANERYLLASGTWLRNAPLSSGAVDMTAFLAALPQYSGAISLEINGTDEELAAAIAFLRDL